MVSSWVSDPAVNHLGRAFDVGFGEPYYAQVSQRNRRRTLVKVEKMMSRSNVHTQNAVSGDHPEIFCVFIFVQEVLF